MTTSVIHLDSKELDELIDRETRARLGMSGNRFKSLWFKGGMRQSVAAHEIAMLLRLDKSYKKNLNGKH